MALTINDIHLGGVVYENVYTTTSIVVGTALVVQNKSSNPIYLQVAASAPAASDRDGKVVYPGKEAFVTGAVEGLFAFGTGRLHVEVDA